MKNHAIIFVLLLSLICGIHSQYDEQIEKDILFDDADASAEYNEEEAVAEARHINHRPRVNLPVQGVRIRKPVVLQPIRSYNNPQVYRLNQAGPSGSIRRLHQILQNFRDSLRRPGIVSRGHHSRPIIVQPGYQISNIPVIPGNSFYQLANPQIIPTNGNTKVTLTLHTNDPNSNYLDIPNKVINKKDKISHFINDQKQKFKKVNPNAVVNAGGDVLDEIEEGIGEYIDSVDDARKEVVRTLKNQKDKIVETVSDLNDEIANEIEGVFYGRTVDEPNDGNNTVEGSGTENPTVRVEGAPDDNVEVEGRDFRKIKNLARDFFFSDDKVEYFLRTHPDFADQLRRLLNRHPRAKRSTEDNSLDDNSVGDNSSSEESKKDDKSTESVESVESEESKEKEVLLETNGSTTVQPEEDMDDTESGEIVTIDPDVINNASLVIEEITTEYSDVIDV